MPGSSPRARGALKRTTATAPRVGIIPACAGSTWKPRQGCCRGWDHPRVRGEHTGVPGLTRNDQGSSPRARGAHFRPKSVIPPFGIIPACAGSTAPVGQPTMGHRDHPRVRGEHRSTTEIVPPHGGSSPRARGALGRVGDGLVQAGIIPACAGSTPIGAVHREARGDHPRVRGEHEWFPREDGSPTGSSPRARGARPTPCCGVGRTGIIPACAGSTRTRCPRARTTRDHPRVRGEHLSKAAAKNGIEGSSPRARGARAAAHALIQDAGIIPACAGSTLMVNRRPSAGGDHPRVRGEHSEMISSSDSPWGSSPRARGARNHRDPRRPVPGIIPACAGSTLPNPVQGDVRKDHPRVRGEHATAVLAVRHLGGSSPRARGALGCRAGKGCGWGIIPACAGSTADQPGAVPGPRDHPRVRGEHSVIWLSPPMVSGSSPRARGARVGAHAILRRGGIIPACAGSTMSAPSLGGDGGDHPRVRGEHQTRIDKGLTRVGSSPRARGARRARPAKYDAHGIIPACAGSTV